MESNGRNQLEMGIEQFSKPSDEKLEILRLREHVNVVAIGICSISGISLGLNLYLFQVLSGIGPIV